jgi:segregation and condensation protein A
MTPLALVQGTPLHALPEDLYIPPDALEVILETFEGPLDLLLYLIRRQNLSILDIPVFDIARQYLYYIDMMNELHIELASEYLLIAAILAEIKSRILLPRPVLDSSEEEDPRAELVCRLQEYERYKIAAQNLDTLPRCERDIFEISIDNINVQINKIYPDIHLQEVLLAFHDILQRQDCLSHHQILREPLSVRERMSSILAKLRNQTLIPFWNLFDHEEGRRGAVVSLLAILELCKECMIQIIQEGPLGPLQIQSLVMFNSE